MFNEKEGKERRKRNDGVVVKKFFPRLLYLWVLLIADVAFFYVFLRNQLFNAANSFLAISRNCSLFLFLFFCILTFLFFSFCLSWRLITRCLDIIASRRFQL